MLTAILRRSEFSCPGKRSEVDTPDMTVDTRWLRSPYEGFEIFKVRLQISYRASLSIQKVESEFSTSWWTESVALYGSTTVSDTLGDGTTLKVAIIRSGNSK